MAHPDSRLRTALGLCPRDQFSLKEFRAKAVAAALGLIPGTASQPQRSGRSPCELLLAELRRGDLNEHTGVLGHQQASTTGQRATLHLAADESLVGGGGHNRQGRVRL